jgi:hypothetical protein
VNAPLELKEHGSYLLDGDGRTPVFLLVEQRQADGAGGVDVRVEERRGELDLRGTETNATKLFFSF